MQKNSILNLQKRRYIINTKIEVLCVNYVLIFQAPVECYLMVLWLIDIGIGFILIRIMKHKSYADHMRLSHWVIKKLTSCENVMETSAGVYNGQARPVNHSYGFFTNKIILIYTLYSFKVRMGVICLYHHSVSYIIYKITQLDLYILNFEKLLIIYWFFSMGSKIC